jgi:L-fucose isomerase-like protein
MRLLGNLKEWVGIELVMVDLVEVEGRRRERERERERERGDNNILHCAFIDVECNLAVFTGVQHH